MRPTARVLVAVTLALALQALALRAPARADEAGVRRLVAALSAVDEAPDALTALAVQLRGLEGLRLDAADAAATRRALGSSGAAVGPLLDALRELTVQGGVVRLALERPAVLTPRAGRRGVIALAPEASFAVRTPGPGRMALEDVTGVRVGPSAGATLELRRLVVAPEAGRSVGRADLRLGFVRKALTFDLGPAAGLAGAVAP